MSQGETNWPPQEGARSPKEPPYAMKICENCGEYDFAGDFKGCYSHQTAESEKLVKATKPPTSTYAGFQVVCSTCWEKAYINENESDGAYKTRMAMRKVEKCSE